MRIFTDYRTYKWFFRVLRINFSKYKYSKNYPQKSNSEESIKWSPKWQIIDKNRFIQNGASLYKGSEFKKQVNNR